MVGNSKNKEEQQKFLNLKTSSAFFINYKELNLVPNTLLADISFELELSNKDYGSVFFKDSYISRGGKYYSLAFKYYVPKYATYNSEFKDKFISNFEAVRNELNKSSHSEINFEKLYQLQLEFDEIAKSSTDLKVFFNLTPKSEPEYNLLFKKI